MIVSPLARVGPGVTVPTGFMVLPGADVTTDAEASNPGLGMVVPVTASELATVVKTLSENESLAAGYTTLYQGNSATGASPGASPLLTGDQQRRPGRGPRSQPAAWPALGFVRARQKRSRIFVTASGAGRFGLEQLPGTHHRRCANRHAGTGGRAQNRPGQCHSRRPGTADRDRFDRPHRQPRDDQFAPGWPARDRAKLEGESGAVILSGPNVDAKLGDDVKIGAGAVVSQSSLGANSTVGSRRYLFDSTFPANTVIPAKRFISTIN